MAQVIAALASIDDILEAPGKMKKVWNQISAGRGRHSLTLGEPSDKDKVLYQEELRKGYEYFGKVSHTFSYTCKSGEEITAVLAYDVWSDDTGGNPEKKSGGVGQKEVSIEVTSQYMRGFHFKFIVYGKRHK